MNPLDWKDRNGVVVESDLYDIVAKKHRADSHHHYFFLEPFSNNERSEPQVRIGSLRFQEGPVKEVGINGITNEHVLAVVIHRLKALQEVMACRENAIAITKLEEALMWLEKRTADRVAHSVEGTSAPRPHGLDGQSVAARSKGL